MAEPLDAYLKLIEVEHGREAWLTGMPRRVWELVEAAGPVSVARLVQMLNAEAEGQSEVTPGCVIAILEELLRLRLITRYTDVLDTGTLRGMEEVTAGRW